MRSSGRSSSRRERRSAVAGSKQYVFVHVLVRDGAYGQMPRAARADVHRRAADWIESLPADRAEDRSEMLAHHLLAALEYSRAAGLDDTELVPRAAQALRESGDRALGIGALAAALRFYGRLRELDPAVEDDPYFLLSLGLALAAMHGYLEEGGASWNVRPKRLPSRIPRPPLKPTDHARRVRLAERRSGARVRVLRSGGELAEDAPLSPEKQNVVAQVARFLSLAGRYEQALELVEQAIDMAEELGDDELLGDALNTSRGRARLSGRSWMGRTISPGASSSVCAATRFARVVRTSISARRCWITAGDLIRSEEITREGLAVLRADGISSTALRWFMGNLADMTYLTGAWDEALTIRGGSDRRGARTTCEQVAIRHSGRDPHGAGRRSRRRRGRGDRPRAVRGRFATPRLSTPRSS